MSKFQILRGAIALATFAVLSPAALATPISGSATGIASPATTITFDEHLLATSTAVTTQYADLGVTFDPYLYYSSPDSGGPYASVSGNNLGNFIDAEPDPTAFTILFASSQSRASFGMASNFTTWTFEALLGNVVVDSFSAIVGDAYYGFTNVVFDRIRVTSVDNDYMVLDNLQFGGNATAAAVPEPESLALLALGLLGLAVARRKARGQRTA